MLFTRKRKYTMRIMDKGNDVRSRKEFKTKWKINWIYTSALFKDKKETLASLVKILNDNEVKVSEKIISRVLSEHDIESTKPILRSKFYENIKKIRIKFCKYYIYIVDNARYVYTDESDYYKRNPYNKRWIFQGEVFNEEQRKFGNQRISVYGAI